MTSDGETLVGLAALASFKLAVLAWMRWRRKEEFVYVGKVSRLVFYPVKSCQGINLAEADCTPKGLKHDGVTDRHWMLVRSNNRFLSQRQNPKMALISVSCHGDKIHLDAPGMQTLVLPKYPEFNDKTLSKFSVWDDPVHGLDCGQKAADWVCDFLQTEGLRVCCFIDGLPDRDCSLSEKPYPNPAVPGDSSAYADWGPYLLANEASLADLNKRLSQPVEMRRFRPNIVVNCPLAFDEDLWEEIRIGSNVQMRCLDPCGRCVLTTVDPDKGEKVKDREPLKTLEGFRCFPKYGAAPVFCVNLAPDVCGNIRVGDPVYAIRNPARAKHN